MVRDDLGIPHHFAPTSGTLDADHLHALCPSMNVVESFIEQGVLEPVPDDDAPVAPARALVGHAPEAMQYVKPEPPRDGRKGKR
jgi:hypothetical protein